MRTATSAGTGLPVRDETITPVPTETATAAICPKRMSFFIPSSSGSARRISENLGRKPMNALVAVPSEILAGPNASGLATFNHTLYSPKSLTAHRFSLSHTDKSDGQQYRTENYHSNSHPHNRV